jgi:hypothetical protein
MTLILLTLLLLTTIAAAGVIDPAAQTEYRVAESRMFLENAGGMPALCRAGNGDLLFAWATHWEPVPAGGMIQLTRSADDGKTWSEPETLVSPQTPDWSTQLWSGLHLLPDGDLILSYTQHYFPRKPDAPDTEENPAALYDFGSPERRSEGYVIRSTDHGRTWEPPMRLAPSLKWCTAMGRPVTAQDGSVLLPLIGPEPGGQANSASLFIRSRDNGKTWGEPELLAGGPLGFSEVTLGVAHNGDIVAMLRDADAGPRRLFRQTVSHDHGQTWEKPWETNLYGKMPDLLVLPSGRMLLAVGSVDCMDGGLVFSGPPHSSYAGLFLSDDHGRTWRRDVLFTTPDLDQIIPFDSPVLALLPEGRILAISFSADRKYAGDPLLGWTRGMHYTINELE